jgi:hypothetical protein
MSDIENKLLERIAALEAQLSPSRKDADKPAFDKRRAALDPIGYFGKEHGMDMQQMARHFVANALGKDCPPELSAMVQMGPQIVAQSQLEELVTSLSRKVDQVLESNKQREIVASAKTTTVDPVKYPTLASAIKTDPTLLESEMKSLGAVADTADALSKIEERLKPYARAFGFKPPAALSSDSADSSTATIDTTPGFKSANGISGSEVPPLVTLAPGAFTEDDHVKLRNAVLNKYKDVA